MKCWWRRKVKNNKLKKFTSPKQFFFPRASSAMFKSNICISLLLAGAVSAFTPSNFAPGMALTRSLRGQRMSGLTNSRMAVSRKDSYDVTLLPGDGIGPEIIKAAVVACKVNCNRKFMFSPGKF
jgi:hypothetical protein